MMGYGTGFGFGLGLGGWLAIVGCIALVVGLVLLIAWALGRTGQGSPSQPAGPAGSEALDTLRLRFARGQITADEYATAKQVLEAGR